MSWTQQLLQTYENLNASDNNLTPIAHMYGKAQVEVTLDQRTNFVNASIISKEEEQTLIAVTESSAGRSSGSAPHALNDTLSYIAGDFPNYSCVEKEKKTSVTKHNDYMSALEQWCNSPFANEKAIIIRDYLKKNCLMDDLIKAGIVHIQDEKYTTDKINGNEYAKVLVRFRVFDNTDEDRTWKDQSLIKSYSDYYLFNQQGKQDICLITGKSQTITENHPKNIVSVYGNAKLFSANDNSGFTFRGRFENSQEASTVSYEASQKIHSALKWLVSNQGKLVGGREFVCWNPQGKLNLDPWSDYFDETSYAEDQEGYKNKISDVLKGKKTEFEPNDTVIIMGLDAATTGRLSVTYYYELLASNYWDNVAYWWRTVNWRYLAFEDKKPYHKVETPSLWRIVQCAFGVERGSKIEADDAVLKEHVQRLLKCMIERQRFPRDIAYALFGKASNPLAYSGFNREMVLSTACAVITRIRIDQNLTTEGNDNMVLDKNFTDRSYLFGRLLAVYERIERVTLDKNENRETNAIRLQAAFVNHPAQVWKTLEQLTNPYFERMKPGSREFFRQLISEIVTKFDEKDLLQMNKELTETYLLGYYLQRMELNTRKEAKEEKDNE